MMALFALMFVGLLCPGLSYLHAQEATAQVVMRPITTVHSPLVIRKLSTQITDDLETHVDVEINPLNGDITVRSIDLPGEHVSVRVLDQQATEWFTGTMRARKGSIRIPTSGLPANRFAVQVMDEDRVVRHRYLLIKN